jgi:hypothetical protein
MSKAPATSGAPTRLLVLGVLVSYALVGASFGIIYSAAIWYSPFPNINLLFLFAYAFLTSFVAGFSIKGLKARFPMETALLAFWGSSLGFYVSWAAWLSLLHNAWAGGEYTTGLFPYLSTRFNMETILYFLFHPSIMLGYAFDVFSEGLWTIRRTTHIRGAVIFAVWLFEFLLFTAVIIRGAWEKSLLATTKRYKGGAGARPIKP